MRTVVLGAPHCSGSVVVVASELLLTVNVLTFAFAIAVGQTLASAVDRGESARPHAKIYSGHDLTLGCSIASMEQRNRPAVARERDEQASTRQPGVAGRRLC